MSNADAKFEDGEQKPLRLRALDADDLSVISAVLQDAVLPTSELNWNPMMRRFAMLANRFRWEDRAAAEKQQRGFERVQAMVVVENVLKVSSSGVDLKDKEQVLSVLSISFIEGEDANGEILFTLAGDGAISCKVECLDISMTDVTRPYGAISNAAPQHDLS